MAKLDSKIQITLVLASIFLAFLPATASAQDRWWTSVLKLDLLKSTEDEVRSVFSSNSPQKTVFTHGYALTYKFREGYLGISFSGGCVGGKPSRDYDVEIGRVTTIYVYFYENIALKKLGLDLKPFVVSVTPATQGYGRTYVDDRNGIQIMGDARKASSISIVPSSKYDSMLCK